MAAALMPLPNQDFDPTEAGVPWRILRDRGHRIVFATADGKPGQADMMMISGKGLGILGPFMMADANGRSAYQVMSPDLNEFLTIGKEPAAVFVEHFELPRGALLAS